MIHIVNYGMGNLGSIQNMLKKLGVESQIIESPEECLNAEKLILPGVGAFDEAMRQLRENNWIEVLNKKVLEEKVPVLGICLGMQLMTNCSEEGDCKGLGWIEGNTRRFNFAHQTLKVPHMGWNIVRPTNASKLFMREEEEELRFYHVHSYFVELQNQTEEIASTNYGRTFTCAFQKENILGVQFHPEKSHRFGMELLRNFHQKY
jgi:glutamine amidotransferase